MEKEAFMRAGDVMTRDVVTVRPDAMIREAARPDIVTADPRPLNQEHQTP